MPISTARTGKRTRSVTFWNLPDVEVVVLELLTETLSDPV